MAQRIGIVVDSTADFPIEVAEDLQIHIVPVHIFIDGKDYLHGDTISNQQVIDSLHQHKEVKTAPPFPAEYSDLYTRIGHRYDTILSFHVSSELSDCYSSAKNSVRILYDDIAQKIEMVDTQNVTRRLKSSEKAVVSMSFSHHWTIISPMPSCILPWTIFTGLSDPAKPTFCRLSLGAFSRLNP